MPLDAQVVAAALQEQLTELNVVGAGVGVRLGDDTATLGAGRCDLRDDGVGVDGETLFQVGSVSKTLTATLVVILAERGLLSLDERVLTYLPDFALASAATTEAVTVRHLLQHTGGWEGDYTLALGAEAGGSDRGAMGRAVAALRGAEVFGPPGKFFSYNNGAFEACGALVEAVCPGRLYEEVLYEEVIAPLGLTQTFMYSSADGEGESDLYSPEHPVTPGRSTAVGHTLGGSDGKEWVYADPWYDPMGRGGYGDGGILCSASDLLAYGSYWLSEDPAPLALSAAAKRSLVTPTVSAEARGSSVGLSWFISNPWEGSADSAVASYRMFSHGGGMNGQISQLAVFPEADCVLAIATNSSTGGALTFAFLEWVVEKVMGVPLPALPAARQLPAGVGLDYQGEYYNDGSLSKTMVSVGEGGKLAVSTRRHTKAAGYQWDAGEEEDDEAEDTAQEDEGQEARLVGEDLFLIEPALGPDGRPKLGETLGAGYLRFHREEGTGEVAWMCSGRLMRKHPLGAARL